MTGEKPSADGHGIAAVGGYVPRLALPATAYREAWGTNAAPGIDRTAVPDADEDSLTIAAEAGRRALDAAGTDPDTIASLAFATTTPPSEEDETVVRLASLLGIPDNARTREYGRTTRAGVAAVVDAFVSEAATPGLVVAADCPEGTPESDVEAAAGAGAGAVLIVDDGPLRAVETGEHAEQYPGTRFRQRGRTETESLGITAYERDAYRTCVVGAVVDAFEGNGDDNAAIVTGRGREGLEPVADLDAVALTAPDGKLPYRVAGEAPGLDPDRIAAGTVVDRIGDAGVAGPILGLADALADGATDALVVGYGGGAGATAVRLFTDHAVPVDAVIEPETDLTYAAYVRRRGFVTGDAPDGGGANVSVPSWRRTLPQRHRLVAGRCADCGALGFPPEGACDSCRSLTGYEEFRLPGTGTVEAVTSVGAAGAPPEFAMYGRRAGSFGVAVVAFDGPEPDDGSRAATVSVPAAVIADVDPPAIGDRVRTVPRRVYELEGVVRYGLKVVPIDELREPHSR